LGKQQVGSSPGIRYGERFDAQYFKRTIRPKGKVMRTANILVAVIVGLSSFSLAAARETVFIRPKTSNSGR
jgi:hypothetical protein